MKVRNVMATSNKEVKTLALDDLKDLLDVKAIGLKGSPTRVVKSFVKEQKAQGAVLKGLTTDEAVDAIMARLQEGHVL